MRNDRLRNLYIVISNSDICSRDIWVLNQISLLSTNFCGLQESNGRDFSLPFLDRTWMSWNRRLADSGYYLRVWPAGVNISIVTGGTSWPMILTFLHCLILITNSRSIQKDMIKCLWSRGSLETNRELVLILFETKVSIHSFVSNTKQQHEPKSVFTFHLNSIRYENWTLLLT